jgi:hypothetical protein
MECSTEMVGMAKPAGQDHRNRHRETLPRRAILLAGFAGALARALPLPVHASTAIFVPSAAANRRFSALYQGNKIGTHTVSYSPATAETQIETEIALLVKLGPFTVFRFAHRSTENWRSGRLTSLISRTLEHGEIINVEGTVTSQGFRVVSEGGPFIAAAETLTSNSLWTPAVLEQKTLVDAQHGGVIGVSARKIADEEIMVAGRQVRAARYRFVTPYYAGSIWYDGNQLWVRGEFERDGAKIQYRLDT